MIHKHIKPPAGVALRSTIGLSVLVSSRPRERRACEPLGAELAFACFCPVKPREEKGGLEVEYQKPAGGIALQAERETVRWREPRGALLRRVLWTDLEDCKKLVGIEHRRNYPAAHS